MKKKILTLFLAFAIMMTFMPSMAFADTIDLAQIDVTISGATPLCAMSANRGATIEDGKFEFCKYVEGRQCYYSLSDSEWHNNDTSLMQEEPTSLYATDYDYVIVSGKVTPAETDTFTIDTNIEIVYNETLVAWQNEELATVDQGQADSGKDTCVWLDEEDGKINFSLYLIPPLAEAIGEQINEVNVSFEVVDNGKEYSIVDLLDSNLYETEYVVLDEKGISMNPKILKEGNYVIEYTLKAKDDNCFANDGLGTYTGVINALNGGNQSYYGDAKVEDDGKTLTFDVPFAIGGGNDSNNFGKIAIIAAAVAGVAAVVGVVVKNVQNAAMMQQAAFQAKMQQQAVQKQVATIKTVLKGAGVVFSLASFGSSLGKLFQLNQFGFNPFGFR